MAVPTQTDLLISIPMHLIFGFVSFILSYAILLELSRPSILLPFIANKLGFKKFFSCLLCVLFPIPKLMQST